MSTEQKQPFDLADASAITEREDEGIAVTLTDPRTEEPTTSVITIVGTYSRRFQTARDARVNRRLRQAQQAPPTAEDVTANQVALVAECILGWQGIVNAGQPYPFDRKNAEALLTKAPWVREQLERAMDRHAAFFAGSSGS